MVLATGRVAPPRSDGRPSASGRARDRPVSADGLVMLGQVSGSGYRAAPSLVRRGDGQTLQLTPLLYLILETIDGERDVEEIATEVSAQYGRTLRPADVTQLVDSKLRPLGLVKAVDGSEPALKKSNPLLALRFRWVVSDPDVTNRLTRPFAVLFHPVVVVPVVAGFVAICAWTLFENGLASPTHDAFQTPVLLLAVFALTILSAGFHEFGHAAAARYGGATPGAMGAGLYLVWPAFYTDVTDSYRLGRGGRIRTDLGGIYFNAIFTVASFALWWVTGWDALLLIVPAQVLQMLQQLTPFLRFDGYHILADLTGVPDLYHRIKPTLLGLLPHRWHHSESKVLKPWARAVVAAWVLLVVPLLVFSALLLVLALPRLVGTAVDSLRREVALLADAWVDADVAEVVVQLLSIAALLISVLGMVYIVVRLVGRVTESVWRAAADTPRRRRAARATAVAIFAVLVYAWWPTNASYAPVQAYEPGTLRDALAPVSESTRPIGVTPTLWPEVETDTLPTRERPVLAVVMRPVDDDDALTWVFPFNRPLPPGSGDNQAFAVNTTDGTVAYDVAFALVWARDGSVLNRNEAYAFASCEGCAAVAVGFQVVLAIGKVDVAVPENLAGAVNYACISCVTYALASQLVVTLPAELSPSAMGELTALWEEIRAYGEHIPQASLAQLQSDLEQFKSRILEVIERDTSQGLAAMTTTVVTTTAASTTAVATTTMAPLRATVAPQVSTTLVAAEEPRPTVAATSTTAETTTSTSDPTTTTPNTAENPSP